MQQCSAFKYFSVAFQKCLWKDPFCSSYTSLDGVTDHCQSCNYFHPIPTLNNGMCNWTCPVGFTIGSSLTCQSCPSDCDECYATASGSCIRCKAGYVLMNNNCSLNCSTGYTSTSNGMCIRCPIGCTACNFAGECFSCSSNLTLYNLQCLSSCALTGTLNSYSNSSSSCAPCPANCSSCINSTLCIRCSLANPYLDTSNNCDSNCPTAYYPDNNTFFASLVLQLV